MKTHSLARELIALGEALLKGPNVDTKNLTPLEAMQSGAGSDEEMAFGVTTLAQLSKYSRAEWLDFANQHSIPLEANDRDSARNIMGKIMSYLASNEHEIVRVRNSVAHSNSPSSRLNQALSTLLKSS